MGKTSSVSLREARDKLKKSQADVAEDLEVTQAAVSGWESGSSPRPDLWDRIAKAYGIPAGELTKYFVERLKAS